MSSWRFLLISVLLSGLWACGASVKTANQADAVCAAQAADVALLRPVMQGLYSRPDPVVSTLPASDRYLLQADIKLAGMPPEQYAESLLSLIARIDDFWDQQLISLLQCAGIEKQDFVPADLNFIKASLTQVQPKLTRRQQSLAQVARRHQRWQSLQAQYAAAMRYQDVTLLQLYTLQALEQYRLSFWLQQDRADSELPAIRLQLGQQQYDAESRICQRPAQMADLPWPANSCLLTFAVPAQVISGDMQLLMPNDSDWQLPAVLYQDPLMVITP